MQFQTDSGQSVPAITAAQMREVERTLTLAAPKTGLVHLSGELYLADIGILPAVFHCLGIPFESPFGEEYWLRLNQ